MLNYSEDPKTIGLYPKELLEEDLTPDCSGYEAQCNEILEATKGKYYGLEVDFERLFFLNASDS